MSHFTLKLPDSLVIRLKEIHTFCQMLPSSFFDFEWNTQVQLFRQMSAGDHITEAGKDLFVSVWETTDLCLCFFASVRFLSSPHENRVFIQAELFITKTHNERWRSFLLFSPNFSEVLAENNAAHQPWTQYLNSVFIPRLSAPSGSLR